MKKLKTAIRNWLKDILVLYDIEDLTTGGHCGVCGAWINNDILPKDWPWSVCQKCINAGTKFTKEVILKRRRKS